MSTPLNPIATKPVTLRTLRPQAGFSPRAHDADPEESAGNDPEAELDEVRGGNLEVLRGQDEDDEDLDDDELDDEEGEEDEEDDLDGDIDFDDDFDDLDNVFDDDDLDDEDLDDDELDEEDPDDDFEELTSNEQWV